MTRIFDALKKAESTRPHGVSPAPLSPLPAPLHAASAARAVATSPRTEAFTPALPLAGALALTDESIREMTGLRVGLEGLLPDAPTRCIMFVSPQGSEGTSTVALQFAAAVARDPQQRVLLVDAHVRRPVHHLDESARAVVPDPRVGVGLLRSTPPAPNLLVLPAPQEIVRLGVLQPAALRATLDAHSAGFEWVILDGPPVLESPDAAALAVLADATLLVVQAGRTKRPVVARSGDMLKKAGARLVGSVLNRRVLEIPEFIYRRI